MDEERGEWGSKLGFILATTGSAVGLGNIWRFPYIVGTQGGGIFVLIFLAMLIGVGIPLMIGELSLGRAGGRSAAGTYGVLAPGTGWRLVGLVHVAAGFIILSFYSVIAGWAAAYIFLVGRGAFAGLESGEIAALFAQHSGGLEPLLWQGLFMLVTIYMVSRGVSGGIERWSKVLVPLFLVLTLYMLSQVLVLPGAGEGVAWFFRPDPGAFNFRTVLSATGQVFFSLSLGMGAVLTYGSYLSRREEIPVNAVLISLADVGLALLTGLIVIPAVFAFGFEPDAGPSLLFITLPAAFNQMAGGLVVGSVFFLFVTIAALTSAASLLEVVVSYLVDELGMSRIWSALTAGAAIYLLGVPSSLSQGRVRIALAGQPFFNLVDFFASEILLPVGGLFMALFLGWVWGTGRAREEIEVASPFPLGRIWGRLIRFAIPLALVAIFASNLL